MFVLNVITILFVNWDNIKVFTLAATVLSFIAPIIPNKYSFPGISASFSLYQIGYYFIGLLYSKKVYDKVFYKEIAGISSALFIVYCVLVWNDIYIWYLKAIAAACVIYVIMYLSEVVKKFRIKSPLVGKEIYGDIYSSCTNTCNRENNITEVLG